MAPPSSLGKRVKGTQVTRPFVYGTTARPFDPEHNPKPEGVPEDHTHSWEVFVKGIDDTDITYWLRRVQFKLHESIPNHVRMIDGEPGKPFIIHETGWGEFEITIKMYYVTESGEKPQTLYHNLRLHPYGRTDAEKEQMLRQNDGEIRAWSFDDQLFNEPYDAFYEILTSGAHPKGHPVGKGGKGKSKAIPPLPEKTSNVQVSWERSALLPAVSKPGQPFSLETEQVEVKKLREAEAKVKEMAKAQLQLLKEKEARLAALKAENAAAVIRIRSQGLDSEKSTQKSRPEGVT
ncbi:Protein AF-9-like protein [Colletotrichum orbiculare MAFF 240422]|uniref:Protein AF-9 homolog n=1 Tax=Colletotrichum orbiculare (strain 104-T / ATCC 96160 / CBS 514.97 / LARS 414 / MAFF 240422) TaxID=1213857 RepID=A0A484G096_COLOR|nr:Protein AF-9-like protein [Colletotrichum orbiculare MAFF 240422]